MPIPLLNFIGAVGGAIIQGAVTLFGEAAAFQIFSIGTKLAGIQLLGYLAGKLTKVPDFAGQARSFQVLVRGTLEHQRIIYGEVVVGGTIAYVNAAGTNNQSLYHAIMVAGHEINDMTDVWIDGVEIPQAAIDWAGDGSVDSGDFRGDLAEQTTVYFEKNLGGDNQAASPFLTSAFADITSQHQGRNIAYLVSRFDYFENQTQVWSAGVPTSIKPKVQGKKVYDPRSDSSQSFGTGPHRVDSSPTWEYSNNPALCWADYLIDSRLGLGVDPSKVDYGYVASAAGVCDAVVFTPVGTDVRFACNGVLSTGETHESNINKILSSFNGSQSRVGGQFKLRAFAYETPTESLSEDDARDDIQIKLDSNEGQRYNSVRGYFIDKDRLYEAQQFPVATAAEYKTRDNNETKYEDIQLPMTTDVYMAQRLAFGVLEQGDLQETVVFPSNFRALPVEINGTVKVSIDKLNWVDQPMRVVNYNFKDLQGIDLVLRRDDSDAYIDVATNEYTVSSQGSYITADPGVPAPSSLWVLPRLEGNLLQWTPPPARLHEYVRLYVSPTSAWTDAEVLTESRIDAFLHVHTVPREYYYFADAVNFAGEASDRIPNSDYTDIFAAPAQMAGRFDPTFELSENLSDYFTELTNSAWIDTTGGQSATHALGLVKIGTSNAGAGARTNQYMPILGDTIRMQTRYRVNSNYGTAANSLALRFTAAGYRPSPVSSNFSKFQTTEPGSYTQVAVNADAYILTNSITMDGSWYTVSADIDLTTIIDSGATLIQPRIAWVVSNGVGLDASINARHDRWSMFWV